jgi:GNAT superfamily N-acetyltransferase
MRDDLAFRIDTLAAPKDRAAWLDLLRDIFRIDLAAFCRLGIWPEGYRAFSYMDGDVIAANVSCRPLPLVIGGRPVAAGQIHAVVTRPEYRRRGLFHDLMLRTLEYTDARFECVLLYTEIPALYRPFGFRPLSEHRFRGRLSLTGPAEETPRRRKLSLASPEDVALLRGLFARRESVSRRLGLVGNEDIFFATALAHPGWRLDFLPDDDALVVWDRSDGVTRLHDIVASRIPAAPVLAAALEPGAARDGRTTEIEMLFPPDRLDGSFAPVPHAPEDNDILCVRGPFAIEGTPLMLPLTAVS